jgi:hypothetical protein
VSSVLRRWHSAAPLAPHAVELMGSPTQNDELRQLLPRLIRQIGHAAFVVVPVENLDSEAVRLGVEAFHAAGGTARICLAGRHAALEAIDLEVVGSDDVGFLLDAVGIDTPLSELIWDRIQAVRFDADFVMRAAKNLRVGCALESMLALARDIGLCTLGADAMPQGGTLTGRTAFDYLPVSGRLTARLPAAFESAFCMTS